MMGDDLEIKRKFGVFVNIVHLVNRLFIDIDDWVAADHVSDNVVLTGCVFERIVKFF